MKNGLIKKVLACLSESLNNNVICDYALKIINIETIEEFFVLQKLETTRTVDTTELNVIVYKKIDDDSIGTSSFIISHDLNKKEINALIEKAVYSASFAKNKKYDLVKGEKKMKKIKKMGDVNPFELLQNIALCYKKESIDDNACSVGFNSLELFFTQKNIRLINSCGVDYEKKTCDIMVEAIPSYTDKKTGFKTELYRNFRYQDINDEILGKAQVDAMKAANDCMLRAGAKKYEGDKEIDVIINSLEIRNMFEEVIDMYNYANVYQGACLYKVGDDIQTNPLTKMNVKLCKRTKEDFFDDEGILLNDTDIIKNGKLVSYYGGNRFASYLGLKPIGNFGLIKVNTGKKEIGTLREGKYLEILDMSGIQVDAYQGYIGGEIRLALYSEDGGKSAVPVTGISFSGDLKTALNNYEVSKEEDQIVAYSGPKYLKIKDMKIN